MSKTTAVTVAASQALPTLTPAQLNTLKNSLYPGASDKAIGMVVDYCRARGLDPMKKPCHIVPMRVKEGDTWRMREVVMPGIYELRTTAMRTGKYIGQDEAEFGPEIEYQGITAPSWCKVRVRRLHPESGTIGVFVGVARFIECVGETRDKTGDMKVNDRWARAPYQMLEKCAEAAALRKAFPDELGGEYASEELEGQTLIEARAPRTVAMPGAKPEPGAKITAEQYKILRTRIRECADGDEELEANLAGALKQKFGVERGHDLLASDLSAALAWLDEQVGGAPPAGARVPKD